MLELCTQTTNDTVLAMLRILRNPFVHRVITIELTKRQVGKTPATKSASEAGQLSTAKPAETDTVEVIADKPAEEEGEGKAEVKTELESELETEESEEKEGEAKVKEEEQTAASPAKPAAPASASRQPVWNEVKETG